MPPTQSLIFLEKVYVLPGLIMSLCIKKPLRPAAMHSHDGESESCPGVQSVFRSQKTTIRVFPP